MCAVLRTSRSRRWRAIALFLLSFFAVAAAYAAAPQKIMYQGTLRRSGSPYTGNVTFVFRLTNQGGGAEYWTSGSTVVAVTGGLFRYPLGETWDGGDGGFPSISWGTITPYIEVTSDGTTLLPREPLASVPYALSGSGDNLGNHTGTAVLQMGAYGVNTSSNITAARYQINGSTIVAILPGTDSIAYGVNAGTSNASGDNNVFIGNQAGAANTGGSGNVFVGSRAGYSNTNSGNSFFGFEAGYACTGDSNSFFGGGAGYSNTTAQYNSFFGAMAGYNTTTGYRNSFFGLGAGYPNTTGQNNIFIGDDAGSSNTTGSFNSFIGSVVGSVNTIGSYNILIGYNQNASAVNASNELNIGGVLFGNLAAKTIGISTRAPQAALDIVSTGTLINQYAQIWRASDGTIVSSMTATGVLYPQSAPAGDNLGDHTATTHLDMAGKAIFNASSMTITGVGITGAGPLFKVAGSTLNVLANGNVGIGTASPGALLHASSSANTRLIISDSNAPAAYKNAIINSDSGLLTFGFASDDLATTLHALAVKADGHIGIGTTTPLNSQLVVKTAAVTSVDSALDVQNGNGLNMLFVRADGKVGISTGAPAATLDVNGDARIARHLVQAADTGITVTAADFGKTITVNSGSAQTVTLPSVTAADIGATITVLKLGAGTVTIDAPAGAYIADSGSGGTVYNNIAAETYATITLRLSTSAMWSIMGGNGSWTTTN